MKPQNYKPNNYQALNGQAMLFTVMILTGIIVMMTSMVGMLMIFGLRHVTDAQATGDAIFAADTGIECAIMDEFGSTEAKISVRDVCNCEAVGGIRRCAGKLENEADFRAERTTEGEIIIWTSVGRDKNAISARSLKIQFRKL